MRGVDAPTLGTFTSRDSLLYPFPSIREKMLRNFKCSNNTSFMYTYNVSVVIFVFNLF